MDNTPGEAVDIAAAESIKDKQNDIEISEKENNIQINNSNDIDMPLLENQDETPTILQASDPGTESDKEPIVTESQIQEESSMLSPSLEVDLQTESSNTTDIGSQEESIVSLPDSVKTDSQDESVNVTPNVEETDLKESAKVQSNEEVDSQPNTVLSNTEESTEVVNISDESFEEKLEVTTDSIERFEDITLEITETTENSENNTVDTSNEIEEDVCTITEVVPVKSTSDGYEQFVMDQENEIETENAVAHMISSEDPLAEGETEKIEEAEVVVENVEVASMSDEVNSSNEEITEVQFHVVMNEDNNGVSVNGMDQLNKDSPELDTKIDLQSMDNVVSEIQSTVDTVITLPSETVTEVTLSDVQMLESHEGVVTVNELSDQTEQVVILPSDEVLLMETEESYEQVESDDGSIVESEEEARLSKEEKEEIPKIEKEEQTDDSKSSVKIPCHVLGRSVDNPLVDPVRNGRVLLKPRLGVKIPYRNLTSQIVSKQEIAEEIMERSRLRQSAAEPPAGGDVFFAKKLTQRLAKKIVPGTKPGRTTTKTTSASSSTKKVVPATETSKETSKPQAAPNVNKPLVPKELQESLRKSDTSDSLLKTPDTSDKIIDNSDLIALLEGDDVPDWNIVKNDAPVLPNQSKPEKNSSDWEREIALKQLRNLPKQSKGTKQTYKQSPIQQTPTNSKESSSNDKETTTKESQVEPKESKETSVDEMMLRFSSSTPLKTYTRKRKPIDFIKPSSSVAALSPPPKKPAISVEEKPAVQSPKKTAANEEKPAVQSPKKSAANEEKPVVQSPKKPSPSNEEKSIVQSPKKSSAPSEEKSAQAKKSTEEKSKKPTITNEKSSSAQKTSSTVQKSPTTQNVQQKSPSVQKQPSTPTVQKSSTAQKTPVDQKPPDVQKTPADQKPSTDQKSSAVQKTKKPAEEPSTPKPTTPPPLTERTPKSLSPNTYISKSSRIVKRKKIWDPDEVTPSPKLLKSPKVMESVKSSEKSVNSEKKLNKSNTEKSETPPAKPKLVSKSAAAVLKPNNEKTPSKKIVVKKTIIKKKKPKRLTELDRLLMDEGAVNLLYSVKNTEEIQNIKNKKKKTTISLDKAQRELMNKTNELKNDLQINSTKDKHINLRKKEGITPNSSPVKDVAATVLHRKKSKDSVSGSVHSPPASPGFAYSQHAEASRIIRRHSSSSFSSDDTDDEFVSEKTNEKKQKSEPQKKKSKVNHEKQGKALTVADKQVLSEEMSKNFNKASTDDPKYSQFETFNVRRLENLVQIILAPTSPNGQMTLSVQVLEELAELLAILEKDKTCRVAVISSSGSSFCQGIDYKELASDDKTTRQNLAEQYAACVKNFLTALTNFSKILVAGVHGNTVGLGVTMLPLFDMVLASDTATFSAPYARLGCAAEGGTLLTLPHIMHNALASELFFASRKLTAAEALRLGLVTRTLWPDKFQEELISALKVISSQSLQSMQAMKKQLRYQLLENVEASLKSETSLLIEHWTSNECQSNFSSYSLEIK